MKIWKCAKKMAASRIALKTMSGREPILEQNRRALPLSYAVATQKGQEKQLPHLQEDLIGRITEEVSEAEEHDIA